MPAESFLTCREDSVRLVSHPDASQILCGKHHTNYCVFEVIQWRFLSGFLRLWYSGWFFSLLGGFNRSSYAKPAQL